MPRLRHLDVDDDMTDVGSQLSSCKSGSTTAWCISMLLGFVEPINDMLCRCCTDSLCGRSCCSAWHLPNFMCGATIAPGLARRLSRCSASFPSRRCVISSTAAAPLVAASRRCVISSTAAAPLVAAPLHLQQGAFTSICKGATEALDVLADSPAQARLARHPLDSA